MSGRRIDLSVIQVAASVLAAVTGAIVASSLGVAGTVIGVAVVSFATTAGTAIYRHYLGRTQERLRSAAAAMGHLATAAPANAQPGTPRVGTSPLTGQGENSRTVAARQQGGRAAPGLSGEQIASNRPYGAPSAARRTAGGPVPGGPVSGGPVSGGPVPGGPVYDGPVYDGQPHGSEVSVGWAHGGQPHGGQVSGSPADGGRAPDGAPTGQPGSPVHETWVIPVQVAARLRAEAGHTSGPAESWSSGGQPAAGTGRGGRPPGSRTTPGGEGSSPAGASEPGTGEPSASKPDASEPGTAASDDGAMEAGVPGGSPAEDKPGRPKLAAVITWARTERWPKFAAIAVMIFVLAMGGITILEAATGKPLDALIWGAHNSGTTVGNVVSGPAHRSHPAPAKPPGTPAPHRTPSHHTPNPTPSTATPTPKATHPTPTPTPTTHSPSPSATPTPATTHSASSSGSPATIP